ncbi:hypothetical protein XNA1_940005 [Xenorhabdus nematophila str. Anatoliense]|nr:hypothetical protein XNA1_3520004 [Xenorhabdus nematophila str. Anatoliense]CEE96037.1 hypothetical protein XNA1_940005 [Xenorhabdus nematophila str. Anatoliense]
MIIVMIRKVVKTTNWTFNVIPLLFILGYGKSVPVINTTHMRVRSISHSDNRVMKE